MAVRRVVSLLLVGGQRLWSPGSGHQLGARQRVRGIPFPACIVQAVIGLGQRVDKVLVGCHEVFEVRVHQVQRDTSAGSGWPRADLGW